MKELPCKNCIALPICKSNKKYIIKSPSKRAIQVECSILDRYIYQDLNPNNISLRIDEFLSIFIPPFTVLVETDDITNAIESEKTAGINK